MATYCCVVWLFWVTWIKRHWVAFCLAVVAALGGVVTAHIIMWAEPDNIGEHIGDACIVTMVQLVRERACVVCVVPWPLWLWLWL